MPAEPPSVDQAKALALRILSHRARTEAQVRRRLTAAGLGASSAEVVDWLLRLGYLDDTAWAREAARALLRPGRLGPRAAERRIAAAGIGGGLAREAVASALRESAGTDSAIEPPEVALCRALAERRSGGGLAVLGEHERERLARFLIRRGFGAEAVERVVGLQVEIDEDLEA